jgi:1-acyl-sn-glycerol-3-phosphate acyltransferase
MNKVFTFIKGMPFLLACVGIVVWHSLNVTWFTRKKRLTRAMVNQRLSKGARQVLSVVGAKHEISFVSGFKMQQDTPYIYMANHLSLFDLPLLYANISGTTRFLVKKSLFKMPFFGDAITQAEFLSIDIDNPSAMESLFQQVKEKLNSGIRIFVFPEGARSKKGELLPFKPGGFRLARETGAHVIPIGIKGTHKMMPPKTFLLSRGVQLSVRVGHPIDTAPFAKIEQQKQLMDKVEKAIRELCD